MKEKKKSGSTGKSSGESSKNAASSSETKKAGKSAPSKTPKTSKTKLAIPAILLESDVPPPQPMRGPGQKFALGPRNAEQLPPLEESGELPESYGTRTLLLTARDPHWLYAHWDLTREQLKEFNHLSREKHLILRVYVDAVRGQPFSEVH